MYETTQDLPEHVFSNKELTMTPNPKLRQYLRYMHDNHPNDLHYLYRKCQQYVKYGGCYYISWDKWLTKLDRDLKSQMN